VEDRRLAAETRFIDDRGCIDVGSATEKQLGGV
jgi:hypothetical protein